jgi:hypothetical protein
VASTQAQVKAMTGRYSTLNPDRSDSVGLQLVRQKKEFEKKIRHLFDDNEKPAKSEGGFFGRKSLVDLYDNSMKLV